jgi:hypothetical protein
MARKPAGQVEAGLESSAPESPGLIDKEGDYRIYLADSCHI